MIKATGWLKRCKNFLYVLRITNKKNYAGKAVFHLKFSSIKKERVSLRLFRYILKILLFRYVSFRLFVFSLRFQKFIRYIYR